MSSLIIGYAAAHNGHTDVGNVHRATPAISLKTLDINILTATRNSLGKTDVSALLITQEVNRPRWLI